MFIMPYWDSAQRKASPTELKAHGQQSSGAPYSDHLTQIAKYMEDSGGTCWRMGLSTAPMNTPCPLTSHTPLKAQGARIKENSFKAEKERPTLPPGSSHCWGASHCRVADGLSPQHYWNLQLMPGNFRASVAWGWGHRLEVESLQSEF